MRVFLDTNVLASAFSTRGLCADLFRQVLASHTLLVSSAVLAELRRAVQERFALAPVLVRQAVALLEPNVVPHSPQADLDLPLDDTSDIGILSSAVRAGADFFVTGDKELQQLGTVGHLEILSPREFWEAVNTRRSR